MLGSNPDRQGLFPKCGHFEVVLLCKPGFVVYLLWPGHVSKNLLS